MSWGLNSLGKAIEDNFSPAGLEQRRSLRDASDFNRKLIGQSGEIWDRAQKLADRPYEAYSGQRIADLSANEQQGINLAQNEGTLPAEDYAKSGSLIDKVAGNDFSGDTISKYMNPYTENVTNRAIGNINLNAAQNQNTLRGQAASRGAFGSTRQAMLEGTAEKSRLNAIGDTTAQGQANAYDDAIKSWSTDNQRSLGAAQAYRDAGNDISKMNSQHVADLMMTGGADRVLQQMKLDTNYQTFLDKQNWDANNLNYLVQALSVERGNTASPYGLPKSGNSAGQVLGALSALVGMFKKNGSDNNNSGSTNNYYNYDTGTSSSGESSSSGSSLPDTTSGGNTFYGDSP